MREKILQIICNGGALLGRDGTEAHRIADAILAAIGEGQEPVAWRVMSAKHSDPLTDWIDGDGREETSAFEGSYVQLAYASPQPAPDVAAMQSSIAELERKLGEAHCDASHYASRCAELERVQGMLVEALKASEASLDAIADGMTVGDRWTNAGQTLLDTMPCVRAALAEVQKPTTMRKVYLVPRDDESMEQLDQLPPGVGAGEFEVAYAPAAQQPEGGDRG